MNLMLRIFRCFILIIFLIFCFTEVGLGKRPNQVPVGARPLGMGETFVAIADDANAIYWNPAGLPTIQHQEINSMYADLYGVGLTQSYLCYVLPITDNHVVGIDWEHLGFEDSELSYRNDRANLSYGYQIIKGLSIGVNVKYVNTDTGLDGNSVGKAWGWGADAGVRWAPADNFSVGLMAHDFTGTEVRYDNRKRDTIFPRQIRFGAAFKPMKNSVIAIDLDDRIHIGAEHWFYDILAVRGGIQKDFVTGELPLYSVGGSLKYSLFQFDYAYQHAPPVDDTHRLSMSMAFDFNPSLVKIQKPEISSIFPSLYKYYLKVPIGKVTLRNKRTKEPPLEVTVSLYTPYSKKAIETGVNLEPGATKEVQITAAFSDKLFEVTSTTPKTAEIKVSYQSGKRTKTTTKTVKMWVYDRNSIRWSDGIDRAAVFVTSKDAVLKDFVNKTLQEAKKHQIKNVAEFTRIREFRNLTVAMILFDALAAYGISYKADPENSYERMSAKPGIIDTIQYPRELLRSRMGDCDDVTVLYMACLANNDIPTAFVEAPKHIYSIFDLGIKPEDAEKMLLNKDLYIVRGGSVWIPVETTKLGKGSFLDACFEGVREYRVEKASVIELADARRNFEQVSFKAVDWLPQVDASVAVSNLLIEDIKQFVAQRDAAILQKFAEIEKQNLVQQAKFLARGKVYANCRMFDKAEQEFKKVEKKNFDTLFNIGLSLSGQNKEIDAIKNYEKALLLVKRRDEQAKVYLALARSYKSQGNIESFEQALQQAFKMQPNLKYNEEVKKLQTPVPPKPGEPKAYEADEVLHLDLILKLME